MFSIAQSRYTLPTQFLFLTTNAAGIVLGLFYNANTPDLYPSNAHHKLGWLVFWVACTQVCISLVGCAAGALGESSAKSRRMAQSSEEQAFIPVSTEAMAAYQRMYTSTHPYGHAGNGRFGADLDGSERSNSVSTMVGQESPTMASCERPQAYEHDDGNEDDEELVFKPSELGRLHGSESLVARVTSKISQRAWAALQFVYKCIDRTILILGWATIATGIITYARFFVGALQSECIGKAETDNCRRRVMKFSAVLHTGSRVACSFGTAL